MSEYKDELKLSVNSTLKLNCGVPMPLFGLGTSRSTSEDCQSMVKMALEAGYRHFDTATLYGNEADVGKALKDAKVKRSDIFITTKLHQEENGYETALKGFEKSLVSLGLDYVDLYLIHWPCIKADADKAANIKLRADTWSALERINSEGKAKAIGVSNFTVAHLTELLKTAKVVPAVNQVEYHPRCQQAELLKYCHEKGIVLESYSTLGKGQLLGNETIKTVAQKYKKSVSQILLRWSLQTGVPVIPKSSKKDRLIENMSIFDFTLAAEDMETLKAMNDGWRCVRDPTLVP